MNRFLSSLATFGTVGISILENSETNSFKLNEQDKNHIPVFSFFATYFF